MAYEIPGKEITLPQGGDLSAKQFYGVKLNSSDQIVIIAAVTDKPIGIVQQPSSSSTTGEGVGIMTEGVGKVIAGGTLAAGDSFGFDNAGKAVAYVQGTDTTKYIVGQVLEGAAANGIATVAFNCTNAARGA